MNRLNGHLCYWLLIHMPCSADLFSKFEVEKEKLIVQYELQSKCLLMCGRSFLWFKCHLNSSCVLKIFSLTHMSFVQGRRRRLLCLSLRKLFQRRFLTQKYLWRRWSRYIWHPPLFTRTAFCSCHHIASQSSVYFDTIYCKSASLAQAGHKTQMEKSATKIRSMLIIRYVSIAK